MSKVSKYKAECLDAWNKFDQFPMVHKLKITIIPEKPKPESIVGYGLSRDERIFKPIVPKVIKDSKGETWFEGYETVEAEDAFLEKLMYYRKNGYWFYNDDRLEWITGDHWYSLNVMNVMTKARDATTGRLFPKRKLPDFVDAQQWVFWAWEEVNQSRYVSGLLVFGPRRMGKTLVAYSPILNGATRTRDALYTMQAQSRDLVKKLYLSLMDIWTNLPKHPFFFPLHSGKSDPQNGLHLVAPSITNRKQTVLKRNEESLNTHIEFGTNKSSKFDGLFVNIVFLDEICKWETQDITETVATMVETLKMGGLEPVGKMYACTTAENIGGKTLEPFTRLWRASNCDNRDVLNCTPSGLLGVFISGAAGYRHDPEEDGVLPEKFRKPTVDKWGRSNIELATEIHEYKRAQLKGEDRVRYIRKYPLNEDEPLILSSNTCAFDALRLNDQINHNELHRITIKEQIVRGKYEWVPGREWREVAFYPSGEGHHLVSWMPNEEDRNKWEIVGGQIKPTRGYVYNGVDPFSHKYHEDKRFSKGASTSLCLGYPNTHPSIGFTSIYCHRPESPAIFFEEMIKKSMFDSSPIMIENQKSDMVTWAETMGVHGFFEKDPMNMNRKNVGVSVRGDEYRTSLINGLMAFIYDHIGEIKSLDAHGFETSHFGDCPFDDLLKDWLIFDPQKWTKYDLTCASMMAICALRKPVYTPAPTLRNFSDYF